MHVYVYVYVYVCMYIYICLKSSGLRGFWAIQARKVHWNFLHTRFNLPTLLCRYCRCLKNAAAGFPAGFLPEMRKYMQLSSAGMLHFLEGLQALSPPYCIKTKYPNLSKKYLVFKRKAALLVLLHLLNIMHFFSGYCTLVKDTIQIVKDIIQMHLLATL